MLHVSKRTDHRACVYTLFDFALKIYWHQQFSSSIITIFVVVVVVSVLTIIFRYANGFCVFHIAVRFISLYIFLFVFSECVFFLAHLFVTISTNKSNRDVWLFFIFRHNGIRSIEIWPTNTLLGELLHVRADFFLTFSWNYWKCRNKSSWEIGLNARFL